MAGAASLAVTGAATGALSAAAIISAPAAAASRLEAEVVTKWEAAHRQLAAVRLADAAPAAKRLQLMVRYTALRREMLSELAQGLRHDDRLRLEHANALATESHRLLDELRRSQRESK